MTFLATINNQGNLYRNEVTETPFKTAVADFTVGNADSVIMTKQVDRPTELYFPNDEINFIITITNTENVAINNLIFTDNVDNEINPIDGTNFTVTTTSGTVVKSDRNIKIENIDLPASATVTIMITGTVA